MRALLGATAVALALGVFVVADVMAKGEDAQDAQNVNITIGPIEDIDAGTPTIVTAQVTASGQPTTELVGTYLTFYEPVSRDQLEFSLNYDASAGAYVALVTLPHEGRWLIDAGTRLGTGSDVPYGMSDGTHVVSVRPAPPPAEPAFPALPFLAGAAVASAAWVVGIGFYGLRRRAAAKAAPASIGGRVPA